MWTFLKASTKPLVFVRVVFLIILSPSPLIAKAEAQKEFKSLLELSLDELQSLKVGGYAVRDLGLNTSVHMVYHGEVDVINIPSTVEVINEHTISARGLANIVEVIETLGVHSGESPSEPFSFSMRGFTRDSVKVLYDGVSLGATTLNMRPLAVHNVQQVELVKGLGEFNHGQGASGGSINVIWKKPNKDSPLQKSLSASYGEYNSKALGAELNAPFSSGALRLDLYSRKSDGWVDDGGTKALDLHAAYLWDVSTKVDLTFSYAYLEDELSAYWGAPYIPAESAKRASDAVFRIDNYVLDESLRFVNYNVEDAAIESQAHWLRADASYKLNQSLHNKTSVYFYTADRFWKNAERYVFNGGAEADSVDRDRLLVNHDREVKGIKSDFIWQSTLLGFENSLFTSFELSDTKFDRILGFNAESTVVDRVDLKRPIAGSFGDLPTRPDNIDETTVALNLNNNFEVSESIKLSTGMRIEQVAIERARFNFDGTLRGRLIENFHNLSYRIAASYLFSENISAYINHGLQHDNITSDLLNPFVEDFSDYQPSDTYQWELGFKQSLWGGNLQSSLALYSIAKRSGFYLSEAGGIAETDSKGIDFSVSGVLTKRVKLGGNVSLVDANYVARGPSSDFSESQLLNVPEDNLSVWSTLSNVLSLPIELGVGYSYVSERFAQSGSMSKLNDYSLLHLFTAYSVDNFRVMFHVNNIADEMYVPWADIYYPDQGLTGPPRQARLSLKVNI